MGISSLQFPQRNPISLSLFLLAHGNWHFQKCPQFLKELQALGCMLFHSWFGICVQGSPCFSLWHPGREKTWYNLIKNLECMNVGKFPNLFCASVFASAKGAYLQDRTSLNHWNSIKRLMQWHTVSTMELFKWILSLTELFTKITQNVKKKELVGAMIVKPLGTMNNTYLDIAE